jgi:hypothetical protein
VGVAPRQQLCSYDTLMGNSLTFACSLFGMVIFRTPSLAILKQAIHLTTQRREAPERFPFHYRHGIAPSLRVSRLRMPSLLPAKRAKSMPALCVCFASPAPGKRHLRGRGHDAGPQELVPCGARAGMTACQRQSVRIPDKVCLHPSRVYHRASKG